MHDKENRLKLSGISAECVCLVFLGLRDKTSTLGENLLIKLILIHL